jgi:chemotaxis signal transduction protein
MSDDNRQATPHSLYQAVRCGALRVAFPYGWANTIVEKFSVTPVPKAPSWLLGAANVDGRIFPVIDLAHYAAPGTGARHAPSADIKTGSKAQRLLIGGVATTNTDDRLAILFDGLPQQIGGKLAKFEENVHNNASAPALIEGTILASTGERFALVNVEQLVTRLSAELSTL